MVAGHLNVGAPPEIIDTFAIDLTKGSLASGAPARAKAPPRKRAPRAKGKAKADGT